jgi:hypothetical protein
MELMSSTGRINRLMTEEAKCGEGIIFGVENTGNQLLERNFPE